MALPSAYVRNAVTCKAGPVNAPPVATVIWWMSQGDSDSNHHHESGRCSCMARPHVSGVWQQIQTAIVGCAEYDAGAVTS